jgi:hypothetical protein
MANARLNQETQDDLAGRLLRERDEARASHLQQVEVKARIQHFEAKYGIASRDIHDAIDRGQLRETHEVARWVMDYELLRHIEEGSTR